MLHRTLRAAIASILLLTVAPPSVADEAKIDTSRGGAMIAADFRDETRRQACRPLNDIKSLDEWKQRRDALRGQLFEMLSLDPLPDRTDLKATVTGRVEHDDFIVEKLHYQSRPGLYVTANLLLPK